MILWTLRQTENKTPEGGGGVQKKMNLQELTSAVKDEINLTERETKKAIRATFDAIFDALENGEKVKLHEYMTFLLAKNPSGREMVDGQFTGGSVPPKHAFRVKVKNHRQIKRGTEAGDSAMK